jgi:cytochrome b561
MPDAFDAHQSIPDAANALAPARWHGRYTALAQALHWITALCMFIVVPVAWVMVALPHGAPAGPLYTLVHKSFGELVFFLAAARVLWRMRHPAPPLAGRIQVWEELLAKADHWLLYAILFIMPVSGYVMSTAGGHPAPFFGLFDWPGLPADKEVAAAARSVHLIGQYFVYAFVALHVAGVAWHIAVKRDATFDRMIPPQREAQNRPAD